MSQGTFTYIICTQCGGAIPSGAPRVHVDRADLVAPDGEVQSFTGLDFCSAQHMSEFVTALPNVPVPDPPYEVPPAPSLPTS